MPWNRNRMRPTIDAKVPEEVEQYYQATRKERIGVAWLLAAVTLLITVLIAALLFFGGRWVYRKITSNDSSPQPETVQQQGTGTEQQPTDTTLNQSSPNTNQSDNQNNSSQDSGAPQPTAPKTKKTPSTGPETPEIPRTGPTSNE